MATSRSDPAIDAKAYAMARFSRALRDSTAAHYVDANALQSRIDRYAADALIVNAFSASEQISRVAVMSGTR